MCNFNCKKLQDFNRVEKSKNQTKNNITSLLDKKIIKKFHQKNLKFLGMSYYEKFYILFCCYININKQFDGYFYE